MKTIEVEAILRETKDGKIIVEAFVEQDISKEDAKLIAERIKKAVEKRHGKTPMVKIKKAEDREEGTNTKAVEKAIEHIKDVLNFGSEYSIRKAVERTLKILEKEKDPEVAQKLSMALAVFIALEEDGMEAVKALTLYGFREEKITDSYIEFLSDMLRNEYEEPILRNILIAMEDIGLDNTPAYNLAYDIFKQERD